MKLFKTVAFGLAAGVALSALILPTEQAEARVVAYSTLQVSNFLVTQGGAMITNVQGTNTTSSSATLTGYAGSVQGDTKGALANSDALASCTGQPGACAAIGQNNYTQYSAGNTGLHFSRADSSLVGNILTPPGASASSVAEVQLNSPGSGNSAAGVITGAEFIYEFGVNQGGDLVLSFDSLFDITLFSDEELSTATGDTQWTITLFDITNGGNVAQTIAFTGTGQLADLNNSQSLFGPGTNQTSDSKNFELTVSGLQDDHTYRFSLTHNTKVSATKAVSEPAALGLLGLGLVGLGFGARRRRKAA